ncbi:MAG: flagellar biosynthesis protein FlhB [Candidatus Zixiibacteriota bacterium]
MAEDNFQERTEKATPRRRRKAREEGRVARSQELNSAIVVCLGFTTLYLIGPYMVDGLKQVMSHTMANAPLIASSDPTFIKVFSDQMFRFFTILLPLFAVMVVIGLGANVAQVGFKISTKAIEPKMDKLNLASGLKRLFSLRKLVEMSRDTIKLLVVFYVAYRAIQSEFEDFFLLPDMDTYQLAVTMGKLSLIIALKIGAAILVIGILDYAYQKYEFEKSIKMSKQEIKDEYKDTDGSPQIKSRIRQLQREMARRRMMQEIPKADVVLTNPTHLAVALKYDPGEMQAPQVVAKGERLLAERIKKIAYEHNIPVIENKPLARALFKMCNVGQFVPGSLYRAVAEVLAYVYRMKGKVLR